MVCGVVDRVVLLPRVVAPVLIKVLLPSVSVFSSIRSRENPFLQREPLRSTEQSCCADGYGQICKTFGRCQSAYAVFISVPSINF